VKPPFYPHQLGVTLNRISERCYRAPGGLLNVCRVS